MFYFVLQLKMTTSISTDNGNTAHIYVGQDVVLQKVKYRNLTWLLCVIVAQSQSNS